ncbi:MAG: M48 family metallopeptidase [Tenericutes bacterium]|nr:M48 family metallopeptidase [Mycoplasmatota bacterium]
MIYQYKKNGKILNYQIHRKRIKNTYFRIRNQHLLITTNQFTTHETIMNYIDQKFDHFHNRLESMHVTERDDEIMLWDVHYQLIKLKGKFSYEIDVDRVIVHSNLDDIKKIKQQIYKNELSVWLHQMEMSIEENIKNHGLSPLNYKLKYLKSKFGSYHRKNHEITLNTFLARLNPIYLTYVIYHEYAHALVFNHSKDFYNLLSKLMPNHKVYQKDLRKIAII